METGYWRLFLTSLLLLAATKSFADGGIYSPDDERIILHEAQINAQDIELGFYTGMLSVQDFGTSGVLGFKAAYHVSEDFFLQFNYADAKLKKTSFEKLNPGFNLLSDDERKYRYYTMGIGFNVFQGESFLASHAFNSAFYLTAAAGATEFAGDTHHTVSLGFGYRIVFLDWLSMHIDARDHIFESDIFGEDELFQSIELTTGLSVFF